LLEAMIAADYVTISANQSVVPDPDRRPGTQVSVSAKKHISSCNHQGFAASLGRTPDSTLAFNDRADAKFQPWRHVSAPSQFNRFVNRNPVPTHFSQPRSAQAPSLKVLI
jgi:hypothetical protein